MTRRAWIFVVLGFLAAIVVDRAYVFALAPYTIHEKSQKEEKPPYNERSSRGPFLAIIIQCEDFIDVHEKLFIVLSTIAIAIFTATLYRATNGLFVMSEQQGYDMKRSLHLVEDTAKKDLRAYVALNTISHDRAAGPLRIKIQNYGRTPAHHVSVVQTIFTEAQESSYRHPPTTPDDALANQMLHPGQSFNHDVASGQSNRTLEASLHHANVIYVYGRIDYMDIYKRWWVTYFCEIYNPGLPDDRRCSPHAYHNYEYPLA